MVDLTNFKYEVMFDYQTRKIFFDFDIKIKTGNTKNTFPNSRSLVDYLNETPKTIYFTLDKVKDFEEAGNNIVINYDKYNEFCSNISKRGKSKIQAFFTRKLRNYTAAEEEEIKFSSSKDEIVKIITKLSDTEQIDIIKRFSNTTTLPIVSNINKDISDDELLKHLEGKDLSFLKNIISNENIEVFLTNTDAESIIDTYLSENITKNDIVSICYRKEQLIIFKSLLDLTLSLEYYRDNEYKSNPELCKKYGLSDKSIGEKIWQYFFSKNNWIFGYGLDYRYMGLLQREFGLNPPTAGGKDAVNGDFLLGDNKYVHFVELKLPTTPLFGTKRNRANTWQLSRDLFDSKSQILEQKSSGLIKFEQKKIEYDGDGNEIKGSAYDSKTILIIGNLENEINKKDKEGEEVILLDKKVKEKTFELFRNDSRNLDIITYDELYKRACFIVNSKED